MNRIQELRKERRWTQTDLANALATAKSTVSRYESETNSIDPKTIRRLCEIFGVSSDYLLGLSTQRTAQISDADAGLVAAYHAAPESVRSGIDVLLSPYMKKESAAG